MNEISALPSNIVEWLKSRQELADYLCVERSAMSAELGRLKADGKLQTKKNYFKLM